MSHLFINGHVVSDVEYIRELIDLERPMPGEIDLAEINRQMDQVVEPALKRWRDERRDEYVPRYRCREDQEADEAGKPRWGEL